MTPLLDYWLKVNLFLLLFYGCYWLLLRRHTFLTLNRTYLLGSIALALVLPAVHVPGLAFPWPWETSEPVYAVAMADTVTVLDYVPDEADAPLLPDWPVLVQWLFALVAAGMLGRTGWQTGTLLRQIRQWPGQAFPDHTLVLPATDRLPTFSFFRYLVLNPADTQANAVRQHELVHIRQRHTVDVLLLAVLHALCWPNPVLFGYRRAIRQVHEFLADRDAVAQTADHRDGYARFLVGYAFHLPENGAAADALAHSFGPDRPDSPTLKQRIQMLYQQHTRRRALWKYALVLPLATALLAMTTEPDPTKPAIEEVALSDHIVHVHGIVSDRLQQPLPDVTISVNDGVSGTTTDNEGAYDLDVPAGSVLVAHLINFESQEMRVVGKAGDSNLFRTTLVPRGSKGQTTRTAISQNFMPKPDAPATDAYLVSVSGRVSGPDGKPVSGAGVGVKGSQTGTFADAHGNFQINAPANAVLLVSSAGLAPQEIVVMDKSVMAVSVVLAAQPVKRRSAATAFLVHVEGVISGNNKPLPNANVIVQNGTSGTTTDLKGHFRMNVPSGTALIVRASGFQAQRLDINPEDGDQVVVDLALIPQAAASTPPRSATAPLPNRTRQGNDEIFTVVEQVPTFPGGMSKLFTFVNKNLRYPAAARQANVSGKVFVAFIVNTNGRIERPEILKGIGSGCDEEAIRLVKSMPNWIPGKQSGRAVAVKYNLPIHFQLVNGKKAKVYPAADPTGQKSALMNDDTKSPKKENIQISIGSSNKGMSIKGVKDPLYILDGKEVEAAAVGPDQLNTDLVQTIDVLKNEAARAEYGEKGRNGVVRITTKAGAQKKD